MNLVQCKFSKIICTSENQPTERNCSEKRLDKFRIRKIEFDIFISRAERKCSSMLYNRIMRSKRIFRLFIRNSSCERGLTDFFSFFFVFVNFFLITHKLMWLKISHRRVLILLLYRNRIRFFFRLFTILL